MAQENETPEEPNKQPESATESAEASESQAGVDADALSIEAQLEAARAEAADSADKFLRAKAESDNIRRRAEQEVANARKFAVESFAAELLAVKDSLELAAQVEIEGDNNEALAKMREGLGLTLKQLEAAFEKFSISVVAPESGEKFDPERHQAMSMVESADIAPNHIIQSIQAGYLIHERLLRPAMVIVAKAASETKGTDEGAE